MMINIFLKIFLITMLSSGLFIKPAANAGSLETKEYALKAAYLFNFAKFVEWPFNSFSNDNAPIILGILGKDPFVDILSAIEGKEIKSRKFIVKRFSGLSSVDRCHILFISKSETKNLKRILSTLKGFGVLTVGDMPDFARMGGIISFIEIDNKIRFEINLDAAKENDLKISSKLLNLSRITSKSREETDN